MIEKYENGDWEEFELVNGKKNGKATYHYLIGATVEYNYIDGIIQGKAICHYQNGPTEDGPTEECNYTNGIRQGKAVFHFTNGSKETYSYINGVIQGKATFHDKNGDKEEYTYVNGLRQGKAILYGLNGDRMECNYVNSKKEGEAIIYSEDGIEKFNYTNGKKNGKAVCHLKNGDYSEYNYINGLPQGKVVLYYKNGNKEEATYVNGVLQGKAVIYFKDEEGREEYTYVNGIKQGKATVYVKNMIKHDFTYIDDVRQGKAIFCIGNKKIEFVYKDGKTYDVIKNNDCEESISIEEIKNFNKELKKSHVKILNTENEADKIDEKKKQEIDSKIEKCEKLFSELKMKYLETNIDRDKDEFENIENYIKFLSDIKVNELTKKQIEKLSHLKGIKNLVMEKITVYEKELDKIKKEKEKAKEDNKIAPIGCLIMGAGASYYVFKHFSGLSKMVVIFIIWIIAASVMHSESEKVKELDLKQEKINSIINIARRVNKILSLIVKI